MRGTFWIDEQTAALKVAVWVALAQNKPEEALGYAKEAIALHEKQPNQPEGFSYPYICALWANADTETAAAYLEKAYQRVMLVANNLQNAEYRKSWLEDVYINRQIVNDWINEHDL